jgi:hypothetical protein
MGLAVTSAALGDFLSMHLTVAHRALRQDFLIRDLSRSVDMKLDVTFPAIEPVFAALVFDELKNLLMALPAVGWL